MTSPIKSHGSVVVGPYKGYVGRAEFDSDADLFHGEVLGTRDVITFQGTRGSELTKEFKASVDDYLDFCKQRGESPEKPASGKFVVRVAPDIHRNLVAMANLQGVSLNQLVTHVLQDAALLQPRTSAAPAGKPRGRSTKKPTHRGRRKAT